MLLPGLTRSITLSQSQQQSNNAQSRGDHIVVIDPVNLCYRLQTLAKTESTGRDTSYASMYWPWLRTIDPDSGEKYGYQLQL